MNRLPMCYQLLISVLLVSLVGVVPMAGFAQATAAPKAKCAKATSVAPTGFKTVKGDRSTFYLINWEAYSACQFSALVTLDGGAVIKNYTAANSLTCSSSDTFAQCTGMMNAGQRVGMHLDIQGTALGKVTIHFEESSTGESWTVEGEVVGSLNFLPAVKR